ncbi:MAG TPA: glycosyltransferase family 2 protein [Acidimicrobiales bacterium]|nr:glycosyltransferase family 2 protein [Acidimicrobiales bacterium]
MPSVAAVVVNHDAGDLLLECVRSLRHDGVGEIVVVDNASTDGSLHALEASGVGAEVVRTGANLGYGAGANRGIPATSGDLVVVSNPDVVVHPGAVAELGRALAADPTTAIAGPRVEEPDGTRYPSARRFPSLVDGAGHALLAGIAPGNRFSRRYRMGDLEAAPRTEVDWVSGAFFLARRQALEELGGFDEGYFMYAEDTDLCWRARRAGWGVLYVPGAVVTHRQGVSTARRPYRMLLAHHRSVLRFASRTTTGWRRLALPLVALLLGVRLGVLCARQAASARRSGARPAD